MFLYLYYYLLKGVEGKYLFVKFFKDKFSVRSFIIDKILGNQNYESCFIFDNIKFNFFILYCIDYVSYMDYFVCYLYFFGIVYMNCSRFVRKLDCQMLVRLDCKQVCFDF